jgi:hypothetical protein
MFIDDKKLKEPFSYHIDYYWELEDDLILLADAPWPNKIIENIDKAFRDAGVEDPLRQKIVEASGFAFTIDGEINWDMLEIYYRHEAALIVEDEKLAKSIEKEAEDKGLSIPMHYYVYEGDN